ncbi:MAG TPA: hypothetical protein VMM35_12130 [Longimicrobiales bacterium]|nr:hypothetical protein [Longimicrobiales bacterium]
MTRAWRLRAAPVAMLLVAACQDAPTTPLDITAPDGGGELSFLMPHIDPSMLVAVSTEREDSLATGPAKVIEEGEELPPPDETIDPSTVPASDIWNHRTTAGFQTGSAWAVGSHDYQGNKSDITTRVTVFLDGAQIGSQSAYTLQDMTFWLDFGLPKHIQAIARAYVHQVCGLTARGDSSHAAWWEAVPGATIATFGRTARTSASGLASQPVCQPTPPTGESSGSGGGGFCWINVWYDPDTGEVVDWEVLYCEPVGG